LSSVVNADGWGDKAVAWAMGELDSPRGLGTERIGMCGSIWLFVLLLLLFDLLIVGFRAGKTHIALVDTIFAEILLTRRTFNQFVCLNFGTTGTAVGFHRTDLLA
jgi:hypothetical protein